MVKVLDSKFKGCEFKTQWLRCWTLNSRVVISRPTLGMERFRSLGNFVYPSLPQSTQL